VFVVVNVYFVIDSVRKLLDTPSYEAVILSYSIFFYIFTTSGTKRGTDGRKRLFWCVYHRFHCALQRVSWTRVPV